MRIQQVGEANKGEILLIDEYFPEEKQDENKEMEENLNDHNSKISNQFNLSAQPSAQVQIHLGYNNFEYWSDFMWPEVARFLDLKSILKLSRVKQAHEASESGQIYHGNSFHECEY
jgi:hypothetical protein